MPAKPGSKKDLQTALELAITYLLTRDPTFDVPKQGSLAEWPPVILIDEECIRQRKEEQEYLERREAAKQFQAAMITADQIETAELKPRRK